MSADEQAALERLLAIAMRGTGQSRRVADFLLAWWNARQCGGFDLTTMWGCDTEIVKDMVTVFAYVGNNSNHYPDVLGLGYGARFEAVAHVWEGWLVELEGTPQELIAAGVASADMFEDLVSGQRTEWTPYANQYFVKKRKQGRFELELRMYPECCDLSDPRTQATVWWREHGAEVDAGVASALEVMRRPRVRP